MDSRYLEFVPPHVCTPGSIDLLYLDATFGDAQIVSCILPFLRVLQLKILRQLVLSGRPRAAQLQASIGILLCVCPQRAIAEAITT